MKGRETSLQGAVEKNNKLIAKIKSLRRALMGCEIFDSVRKISTSLGAQQV